MKSDLKGYIGIIARMGSERLSNKHVININQTPIIKFLIGSSNFSISASILTK